MCVVDRVEIIATFSKRRQYDHADGEVAALAVLAFVPNNEHDAVVKGC